MPTLAAQAAPGWRRQLRDAVSRVDELLALVGLDAEAVGASPEACAAFRLRVPRGYVARMRPGDPTDPLLRQVLPIDAETAVVDGFDRDPLQEAAVSPAPGVLRKFRDRALLIVTGACAVHCRYCFRRHFPYVEHGATSWGAAIDQLRDDRRITEVVLSGGDPLSASDARLASLVASLDAIPHLRRLRIHSRLPVVLPARVDDAMVAWLRATRLRPVLVIHANHGNEIDGEVREALARLRQAGVTLLNQSVLLRGVNDDRDQLVALSEVLFEAGVLPYYLHMLDPVAGAAHFEVGEDRARRLVASMMRRLPGYLVPRLVREVPGAPAKVPVPVDPR